MKNSLENIKNIIRDKKELSGISESILDDALKDYIDKNDFLINQKLSKKDIKIIVKDIRSSLRDLHGRFQISLKDRGALLDSGNIQDLLKSHLSTKERLDIYPKIKDLIYSLNPKSILDIACGLNPLALAKKDIFYYAIDINNEEISLLNRFFKNNKINGEAVCIDAKKLDFGSLHSFDLCIIFKFLDFIPDGNKTSEIFIEGIRSKNFLVSFATKSVSGKVRQSRRPWFERILKRKNIKFDVFVFENEIFYLFKKQQTIL